MIIQNIINKLHAKYFACTTILFLLIFPLNATDYYTTPSGAGSQDGSSWSNAIPGSNIENFINNNMGPGDRLLIDDDGGFFDNLQMTITNSGTSGNMITIEGVNDPLFKGPGTGSGVWMKLDNAASYLRIKNLRVEDYQYAMRSVDAINNPYQYNIIDGLRINQVYHGIYIVDYRNSEIKNCILTMVKGRGISMRDGCRHVQIYDCLVDHNLGDVDYGKTNFSISFEVRDGDTRYSTDPEDIIDIVFTRCEARNSLRIDDSYTNGDGFTVNAAWKDIRFYNCIAHNNADGGWDDKGYNTYYENCISAGNGNNFRPRNNQKYVNCLSVNPTVVELSNHGDRVMKFSDGSSPQVEVYNCTFHDGIFQDPFDQQQPKWAENCLSSYVSNAGDYIKNDGNRGTGNVFDDTPGYKNPSSDYNPTYFYDFLSNYYSNLTTSLDNYDNNDYPNKGYKYVAPGDPPVISNLSATPTSGDAPLNVQFDVTADDPDGDNANMSYDWDFGDGGSSTAEDPAYTYDTPGDYTAIVTVTDEDKQTTSDNITISVTGNYPPEVSFNFPQNEQRFAANAVVDIEVSASDQDGSIDKVEFYDGTTLLATDHSAPFEHTINGLSEGDHTIEARAYDNEGATGSSNILVYSQSVSAVDIAVTSSAPVIDGSVDALWDSHTGHSVDNVLSGTVNGSSDLSATWKAVWDASNLYVIIDVTDDSKTNDSGADFWKDDGVELYLDMNYDHLTYYEQDDYQLVVRYNDNTLYGDNSSGLNITYAQADKSDGYRVEFMLPWTELSGYTTQSDLLLGIDVGINDDDDGGERDKKIAWNTTTDNAHNDPSLFGAGKLTGDVTYYTISASAGTGGSIDPSGDVSVAEGNNQSFTISADADYEISDVTVDGSSVGAVSSYEFTNVTADHTIAASFNAVEDNTAPTAPTNLSATGGDASVSLNWDDNSESDLAGYNVYRSTTSGSGYSQINGSLVSNSDYTDNSVTNGTTYYYVVTAEDNSANESGYSSEASATPQNSDGGTETLSADADAYVTGGSNAGNYYGTLGELVTKDCSDDSYDRHSYIRFDLSGYTNSVNSATLRLKVNSDAGIDGVVFKEVSDDSWDESTINWNNAPLPGNTISTITSLPSADDWLELDITSQVNSEIGGDGLITLYLESQNRDCKGIVFYSKENGISANDPQLVVDSDGGGDTDPPASPVNLSATGNDGSVSLNWDDNSESDLAGYNVYRSTTSGSGYSQINGSLVSSSDYTDNSVTNGTTYYYVVTAEDNSANESGYSVEASATPQDVTAPAAPVNLSATGNDGSVSLNWDDNSESDLAGYNVYRSTTSGSGYSQINGSLVSNSDYTDNSVTNGTTYYYVVTAEDNSANESGYSSEASAIPQAATNLVAHYPFNGNTDDIANANNGTISGDPQYVTGEDGQGLDFDGNGDYVDVSANSDIGVTQFTISAWINAGSINTGNWQAIIEHDRSGDNWYGLFGDPNENKFHFRWSSSSAADFSSTITTNTWYHVVGTYDGSTAKMYLNGSLDNSVSSSAAVTATTAGLRVGMNMDGNEPFDGTVDDIRIYNEALSETEVADLFNSYSDSDTDPPASPANLSATGNDGSVSLNWDDNSESDLAGYNVYRSTTSGSGYSQINGSLVSSSDYTDNSVTNGTTYYYVVTAEDNSANESGYSGEASATPQSSGGGTETLSADADAYVTGGSNAGNYYGTLGELVTKDCSDDSYDRHSYIRFDLSGYTNSVNSATLRLKISSDAGIDGVVFKEVSDDSWDESTINWNNAPLPGNTISTITSLPSADDWLELDITSQVNSEIGGDGLITLYLESQNKDCKGIVFYSKENGTSANDPQLYVDYGSTKSGSITVAIDDNEFNALSVFPNPADEQVIIQVSADKYDIRIYDVNGNLKKIQRNVSGSKIIQTNEIGTAGVYFIKIFMGDEVLIKKLIIK